MTLLCLLATACVPKEQLYTQKPPANAKFVADIFYPADHTPLPYRSWLPKKKPKAVILAVHGFNDYSNGFMAAGTFFKEHGVAMYAYDQRGFGQSPQTGIWANEKNMVADMRQYAQLLKKKYPHTPIYMLGESMGGAAVIVALADPDFPLVAGAVLLAPAVWGEETMNPIFRATLWLGAHTVPFKEFTGNAFKIQASNNVPMLRRMGNDPLVLKKARLDAVYGVIGLMDDAYRSVPLVKVPVLLLYGSNDQVIPKTPVERALTHFTRPVSYAYYDGSYHMLMRDIQGEMVMRDILSWIEHPANPLPSGYGGTFLPPQ